MHELPRYLTDTTVFPSWDAPTLWLGWIISSEDLLKIVEAHYPDSLMYSAGRPCLSSIHALPQSLRDEYHIEPELHECVDIAIVARPDAKRTTALSVGCSNVGVISLQTIEDIQNKFGLQRSPEWLLDGRDWQWTRRSMLPLLSCHFDSLFPSIHCLRPSGSQRTNCIHSLSRAPFIPRSELSVTLFCPAVEYRSMYCLKAVCITIEHWTNV